MYQSITIPEAYFWQDILCWLWLAQSWLTNKENFVIRSWRREKMNHSIEFGRSSWAGANWTTSPARLSATTWMTSAGPSSSYSTTSQGGTSPNDSIIRNFINCYGGWVFFQDLVYGWRPTRELTSQSLSWLEPGKHFSRRDLNLKSIVKFKMHSRSPDLGGWLGFPMMEIYISIAQRNGNGEGGNAQVNKKKKGQ